MRDTTAAVQGPDDYGAVDQEVIAGLDFPELARRVEADVRDLYDRVEVVYHDILDVTSPQGWEPDIDLIDEGAEAPLSRAEMTAQLNAIAAVAYRIARSHGRLIDLAQKKHPSGRAAEHGGGEARGERNTDGPWPSTVPLDGH